MLVGSSADFSPLVSIRRQIGPKQNLVGIMIAVNKRHQTTFGAVFEIRFFLDWLMLLCEERFRNALLRESNPNHHFRRICFLVRLNFTSGGVASGSAV